MFNITPKNSNDIQKYLSSISNIGRKRKFNKNEFLYREGDDPSHLFYMTRGLVKCFYLNDGKEIILRLMTDDSAVLSYAGFITGKKSLEYIECLQPCEGIWIPLKEVEKRREEDHEIDTVFRYLAEQHYLSMERRLRMLHHKSSKDRYLYFYETMEKKIIEQTPMQSIASYLGVTPESFSRMKRELNN